MYRSYSPWRWPFWNGDKTYLQFVSDRKEAQKRYERYEKDFSDFEFTIPPNKKIKVRIPIVEEWKEMKWFEEYLYSWKVDPIMRAVMERLLKYFYVTAEWTFVKREWEFDRKMDSMNMEKLQSMKDIMLWLTRITPIKINIWTKKDPKYLEREIWSHTKNKVKYMVNGEEHETHMFWLYASNFRDKMFPESDEMWFYGWHALEYRQRDARLRSGYVTTIAACRWLGKTLLVHHDAWLHLVREKVFKSDRMKNFTINYFGLDIRTLSEYMDYLSKMFYNLLSWSFDKNIIRNILRVDKTQDVSIKFYDGTDIRTLKYISQNQESRGWRTVAGIVDEWAHHKNDEAMQFLLGAWFAPIRDISTIKSDTPNNDFYKRWYRSFIQTKKYQPIDEIIHYLRTKHWFNKCTKPEDYLSMAEEWVFDACRAEMFKMLPNVWLKYTIDDAEHYSEEEKAILIDTAENRWWYSYLMAELFSELIGWLPAIRYQHTISEKKPERFDKIFIGYDEAEDFDNPAICCVGVLWHKAYIIHSEILPSDIDSMYKEFREIVAIMSNKCREVVILADCTRWGAIKREIMTMIGQLNYAVKRTHWKNANSVNISKDFLLLWKSYVVNVINEELFLKNRIYIHESLNVDWWLTHELEVFIKKWNNTYSAADKNKDDQVCAMLLAAYWAYEHLKQDIVRQVQYADEEDEIEARINRRKACEQQEQNNQEFSDLLWNIR